MESNKLVISIPGPSGGRDSRGDHRLDRSSRGEFLLLYHFGNILFCFRRISLDVLEYFIGRVIDENRYLRVIQLNFTRLNSVFFHV